MACRRPLKAALLALLAALVLAGLDTPTPALADARSASSLTVAPTPYVGGQAITFRGALGRPGRQRIRLQSRMNRPGGVWDDIAGSTRTTDAAGRFAFRFPAPAMWEIAYRVVSAKAATPSLLMRPRAEEIELSARGGGLLWPKNAVPAGLSFTVHVDTTPDSGFLHLAPPAFPGRTVLLQERRGTGWRTVATGTTDDRGQVEVDVDGVASGTHVYRARQEAWTRGRNRIGSFTSFPIAVRASLLPPLLGGLLDLGTTLKPLSSSTGVSAAPGTAAGRFGWGPVRYDYGWLRGESLESRPQRGTVPRGRWLDTGDGTGRITHFNGGLAVQSGWQRPGAGLDTGTTSVTLRSNAQSTGRWEFNLRTVARERGAAPYRALVELVPEKTGPGSCFGQSIVVADALTDKAGVTFGVASAGAEGRWSRRVRTALANQPHTAAVEVGHDHVTWYVDGKVVGSLRNPAVLRTLAGVALTPRLSLVGVGHREMNASMLFSDWQRAWPLRAGRQVTTGPALHRSAFTPGC